MKQLLLLTPYLFLLSCISEHEKEAIKELSAYGGDITIANGVTASTEKGNLKYKKITVNNSGAVEEGIIEPEILASKYAITVFNKLDDAERDFDKIEVELNKSNAEAYTYEISKNKLILVEKEFKFINKWIDEFRNNKIDESYRYLKSPSDILPQYDQYKSTFEKLNNKFGKIDSVLFDGYVFENVKDTTFDGEAHQFIYDFRTKKGVYAMHVIINPKDKDFKIYGLSLDAD